MFTSRLFVQRNKFDRLAVTIHNCPSPTHFCGFVIVCHQSITWLNEPATQLWWLHMAAPSPSLFIVYHWSLTWVSQKHIQHSHGYSQAGNTPHSPVSSLSTPGSSDFQFNWPIRDPCSARSTFQGPPFFPWQLAPEKLVQAPEIVYIYSLSLGFFFLFFILTLLGVPWHKNQGLWHYRLHCTSRSGNVITGLRVRYWRNFCSSTFGHKLFIDGFTCGWDIGEEISFLLYVLYCLDLLLLFCSLWSVDAGELGS